MSKRILRILLMIALLFAAFLSAFVMGCARRGRINVLFVVVDTLRADRLKCYGWREDTSPHVDSLAERGVLFKNMICQVPQTLPSFCTILTGNYLMTHGVRANGLFALSPEAKTLAEVFYDAGYKTAAFIGGFPLDARFGTDQGFETYWDTMEVCRPMEGLKRNAEGKFSWLGHTPRNFENTANRITDKAVEWISLKDRQPFFTMVHYFDPHHDYNPPERFRKTFPHPYSGEVAFTDEQLGLLLKRIGDLGLEGSTLVVFTADHGECLGEYGRFYHHGLLYEATLHVPFILRLPGRLPEGKKIPGRCRSADIMPTVLELAGLPLPEGIQGESLLPSIDRGLVRAKPCYFETLYDLMEEKKGVSRIGVAHKKWKLVQNRREDPETGEMRSDFELYNLAADPLELRNLAVKAPQELENLCRLLEEFMNSHSTGRAKPLTLDEESLEKLKALGYF